MRRFQIFCQSLTIFLVLVVSNIQAATDEAITLSLPETVISNTIKALLPFHIDAHSKSIDGDITIINISNLQLTNDNLSCRLHLAGNNLAFLTEIAGHEIRLKVGSVEVDFETNAALRFDAKKQVLYIKPIVKDMSASGDGANAEIGQALVALLNGREFPISMNKLDPLVADAGAKKVTINTQISNIKARPDLLLLSLTPLITVQ